MKKKPKEAPPQPETPESRWLLEGAARFHVPGPSCRRAEKKDGTPGSTWTVRSYGRLIGKMKHEDVLTRREDLLEHVCELRQQVTAYLKKPLAWVGGKKQKPTTTPTWEEATRDAWVCRDLVGQVMKEASIRLLVAKRNGEEHRDVDGKKQSIHGYSEVGLALTEAQNYHAKQADKIQCKCGKTKAKAPKKPKTNGAAAKTNGAPSVGAPSVGAPSVGAPSVGAPSVGAPSVGVADGGPPSEAAECNACKKAESHRSHAEFAMNSALRSAIGRDVDRDVQRCLSQIDKGLPGRHENPSIPLKADIWTIEASVFGDSAEAKAEASGEREPVKEKPARRGLDVSYNIGGTWHRFAAVVKGPAHNALVRRLLKLPINAKPGVEEEGEVLPVPRRLAAKLVWEETLRCWAVKMTLGLARPNPKVKGETLAVRLGMRDVLYGLGADGRGLHFTANASIIQALAGFAARKADKKSAARYASRAKRGHGRERRYRDYADEQEKHRNFTDTWCRNVAAKVAEEMQRYGYRKLLLQELTKPMPNGLLDALEPKFGAMLRRFPMFKLRDSIVWAVRDKAGYEVEVVEDHYNATRCPDCEGIDARNHKVAHRTFKCMNPECELELNSDFIAAWNMLSKSGEQTQKVAQKGRGLSKATKTARGMAPA